MSVLMECLYQYGEELNINQYTTYVYILNLTIKPKSVQIGKNCEEGAKSEGILWAVL